jgi:hypothetical protein
MAKARRNHECLGSNIIGRDAGVHAVNYSLGRIAMEYSGAKRGTLNPSAIFENTTSRLASGSRSFT